MYWATLDGFSNWVIWQKDLTFWNKQCHQFRDATPPNLTSKDLARIRLIEADRACPASGSIKWISTQPESNRRAQIMFCEWPSWIRAIRWRPTPCTMSSPSMATCCASSCLRKVEFLERWSNSIPSKVCFWLKTEIGFKIAKFSYSQAHRKPATTWTASTCTTAVTTCASSSLGLPHWTCSTTTSTSPGTTRRSSQLHLTTTLGSRRLLRNSPATLTIRTTAWHRNRTTTDDSTRWHNRLNREWLPARCFRSTSRTWSSCRAWAMIRQTPTESSTC